MTNQRNQKLAVIFAAAVTFLGLSSSSSFAFSSEAQRMCTSDAFRLCSSEIPSIPAITACMRKNKSNLSAGCRMVMDKDDAAAKATKVAAQ